MPWWENLRIDWRDYHANAKSLLDDPSFWDPADNRAADILAAFKTWRPENRTAPPLEFLDSLFRSRGFDDRSIQSLKDTDDFTPRALVESVRDQMRIALAFAQIKTEGICDRDVRQCALEAIERQLSAEPTENLLRPRSPQQRLDELGTMRRKLAETAFG